MMRSREWQLRRRPEGVPSPSDVELVEVEVPEPGPGQVAIANRVLSVEPYMWGRMSAAGTYADPYQIGETMTGHAVGVVTASRAEAIPVGATVLHEQGWREHGVLDAGSVRVLDDPLVPDAAWLGVLGVTGFTAYVALHMIAACRPGETVFVSAAAGAVGSTAVQLAKAQGCRVIGSAGSAEKVAFVRDELGADAAFSYRASPVREGLRGALLAAAEEGIDVYVDNVGGEHLEAALRYIRPFGRVALCGAISTYGNPPSPGPRNLLRAIWQRVRLEGFIVGDHEPRRPDFERAMSRLLRSGAVRGIETASAGIESAFDTFTAMLGGAGIGKSVVRLDWDEPQSSKPNSLQNERTRSSDDFSLPAVQYIRPTSGREGRPCGRRHGPGGAMSDVMRSKAPERVDDMPGVARDTGGAVAVRPGEGLDWEALRTYLASELGLAGEFEVLQFPNGSANLTYLLRYPEQDLVFRRPPFGDLAPGAHDMRREFRVLSRLWRAFNRAPRALLFCDDRSIVGADFLVSEFRVGEVIWDSLPESMAGLAGAARSVGLAVIDALADLHNVDPASCGLADLGRPDGFVRRQVDGWRARWDRVATDDLDEAMRAAGAALAESVPESSRVSILHNDFKIDNCQFRVGDPRRVTSIFDWDMATLGDPLIDLGILLNYWPDPADTAEDRALAYPGLELMGLPTRAEIAARYAKRSGVPVGDLSWYEAFASWKTAIVREQLHSRYVHGESSDPRMALLHDHNLMLARRALRLVTSGAALPPVPHDD